MNAAKTETGRYSKRATGLPVELARRPFGVVRPADATDIYANPSKDLSRLAARGHLHKVATGYYAVVPPHATDRTWTPSLEATAFGIAAADYGVDDVALMGLSAARLHGAVPRAIGVALVAVPKNRPAVQLVDRNGLVRFVRRHTDRLDVERMSTDLGPALVTTVEQTLLDLASRPTLGGVGDEAAAAIRALWPRAAPDHLAEIAGGQRLRSALTRAQRLVEF
jgi:predicted transcriptional regulator of viral defense system